MIEMKEYEQKQLHKMAYEEWFKVKGDELTGHSDILVKIY